MDTGERRGVGAQSAIEVAARAAEIAARVSRERVRRVLEKRQSPSDGGAEWTVGEDGVRSCGARGRSRWRPGTSADGIDIAATCEGRGEKRDEMPVDHRRGSAEGVRVSLPSSRRKGILKLPLVSWSGISNVTAAPDEAHPRPNALSSPPAAPTADTLRLVVRLLACSALSTCLFPEPASASADCAVVESRSSLSSLSGTVITSVDIVSDGPSLPGLTSAFGLLHPVSQASIIRRQLLFAPGDTVDTLLVGETMRRLRAQRLFADAVILARRCDPSGGVALSVNTRDTWTLRPTARMKSQSQLSFGIEERNLLGSGRSMSLTREMTLRGNGAAFALTDPFVFGQDVSGHFRLSNLAGGHALRLGLLRHDYSVFDTWRAEGNFARSSYGDTIIGERALHTVSAMTLVGRRIDNNPTSVLTLLAGAEFDSAASISPSKRKSAVPGQAHVRSFLGADVGLMQRTAQFDTASWIVPGRGFLDVPMGWEGEAVMGGGYERDAQAAALKVDGWTGRVFIPERGQILMVDAWASMYFGHGVDRNQIARASLSWFSAASRGLWGVRVTAEDLYELDPDRRGLSLMPLADYTTPVLRSYAVRARHTVAGSIDRDVRLFNVAASSVLNAGGFIAGSYRWDVDNNGGRPIQAGVIGARLRLLSANGAVSSTRLDIGFPVLRNEVIARKPFVVLTFGSLFDVSRQRDGRRVF